MAKTKSGKKFVRIGEYKKSNSGKVKAHCRSTPSKK